jgi:hypothetical protein
MAYQLVIDKPLLIANTKNSNDVMNGIITRQ